MGGRLVGRLAESGGDVVVSGGTEAADREAPQGGLVLRAVLGVDLGGVLAEGGVPYEVVPVLADPLRTNDLREPLRGGASRLVGSVMTYTVSRPRVPVFRQARWRTTRATCVACGKSRSSAVRTCTTRVPFRPCPSVRS